MKTLDLYIIKKILINWALVLFGVIFLVIIGDMASHIKHISTLHSQTNSLVIFFKELGDYYVNDQLPVWIPTFLPIAALASITLLVLQFKRHHEWIAIASANLSVTKRLFIPLFLIALLSTGIHWWDQEKWLPQIKHVSLKDRPYDKSKDYTQLNGIGKEDQGRLQCVWYRQNPNTVHEVMLIAPNQFVLLAKSAVWTESGWEMHDVIKHDLLLSKAMPVATNKHKTWLWHTSLSLKMLDDLSRKPENLNRRQLKNIAQEFPMKRILQMEYYFRTVKYFSVWIMLFIAFPLIMAGSSAVQCALRATFTFLAVHFAFLICFQLGVDGLSIFWSCAITPIAGLFVGLYYWKAMPQ